MGEIRMYAPANDDDIFESYVVDKKREDAKKAMKSGQGYSDDTAYVGIKDSEPIIVRFVGNISKPDPKSERKLPQDMKFMNVARIKDQTGNIHFLYLPLMDLEWDQTSFIWRLFRKVYERQRDDAGKFVLGPSNEKLYTLASLDQEAFNYFDKGGFTPSDGKSYEFASNFVGSKLMFCNVIDRMDTWCESNKHTKILAKKINGQWIDKGVSATLYNDLILLREKYHKGFECYDIMLMRKREGGSFPKTIVMNASALTTEEAIKASLDRELGIDQSYYKFISHEPELTDTELTYGRYDLDEKFKYTSYKKINDYFGHWIERVDQAMKTNFTDELNSLVAAEENTKHENNVAEGNAALDRVEAVTMQTSAPVESTSSTCELDFSLIPKSERLTDEMKNDFESISKDADGKIHITWKNTIDKNNLAPCDKCKQSSPYNYTFCPYCGVDFTFS